MPEESLYPAIAVSWDDKTVTILCPFCPEKHDHEISHFAHDSVTGGVILDSTGRFTYNPPFTEPRHTHVPPCGDDMIRKLNVKYKILFPFKEERELTGLSFEIDSDGKRFRTVGLPGVPVYEFKDVRVVWAESSSDEEDDLVNATDKVSLQDGDYDIAGKLTKNGVEQEVTKPASWWLVYHAIRGDLTGLKQCLAGSPHPDALVNIKTYERKSLLVLAAQKDHLEVVKYLLDAGCDVDAADNKGRTPLMEAALWGHPQIVQILLKAGAQSLRDTNGMSASNLAEESDRNDQERHEQSPGYAENPYIKKRHRTIIRALLDNTRTFYPIVDQLSGYDGLNDAHFYKFGRSLSSMTISLVIPAQGFKLRSEKKVVALLLRGGPFPPIAAISGEDDSLRDEFVYPEAGYPRLCENYWTAEARNVAADIDLYGGLYYNHAEVHLMAFFVRRHYLFAKQRGGEANIQDGFLQLFMSQPRKSEAVILVSRAPCNGCDTFRKKVLERTGIEFSFKTLPVRTG